MLATALKVADTVPGLVAAAQAQEITQKEQDAADATRRSALMYKMGSCEAQGRAACRAWLENDIAGTPLAPLRETDLAALNLDGPSE